MERSKTSTHSARNISAYIAVIVVSVLLLVLGNRIAASNLNIFDEEYSEDVLKARVIEIESREVERFDLDETSSIETIRIVFRAKVLSGYLKGEVISATQTIDQFVLTNAREVSVGDKVLLILTDLENYQWHFMEYVRSDKIMILGASFIMALLIFGRKKGFNTILSLALTCGAIFLVFIPSILSGKNIYVWTSLICVYSVLSTYLIVNGFTKKTTAAIVGCLCGILLTSILTIFMDRVLSLTGVIDEDSVYLTYLPTEKPINLRAIIFAGIQIGALGAIMDVAMSISSSLWEVCEESSSPSFRSLFRSGLNIGRDVLGTMANTLILAYIGSSLAVVLLLSVYSSSVLYLFNREMIVVELLQALVGSFGLLFTMPFTSFVSALLYIGRKDPYQK
ncbi:MAG: YibE/F family protein [Clostridiales bacterium]|nr:YibE/F family protein [Clostridiales bacterium]